MKNRGKSGAERKPENREKAGARLLQRRRGDESRSAGLLQERRESIEAGGEEKRNSREVGRGFESRGKPVSEKDRGAVQLYEILPLLSVPRPEMRRERPSRSLKRVCN